MGVFVQGPVGVEVPATSANLGPGFDCLGLALDLHDTLSAEVTEGGLVVEVEGEGADTLPADERHLVVRAMRAAFEVLGVEPPGLALRATNRIPQSRGLGSSSAAIVGGIELARALVVDGDRRLDEQVALMLATELEGHPDNVAPALLGGFVVCGHDGEDTWAVQAPLDPAVSAVAFVPPTPVSTELARSLLPAQVGHDVAAANTGRAALLVAVLGGASGGELDAMLLRATEDFVHQEFREPAMPATLGLVRRLRDEGLAAVVSGAGPTVLVLTGQEPASLLERCPDGWQAQALAIDHAGARRLAS